MNISNKTSNEKTWTKEFGHNLQLMIQSKGLTQMWVAEKLNITNAMLSRYIHGSVTPSVYRITQMANVLDCGISELVKQRY